MQNTHTIEERLRLDDPKALERVYREYKEEFINYGKRYNLDTDELLDIYQDTVIALHQSFVTKKTVLKNSGIKTYLFGIGKNKIYNRLKELKKLYVSEKEEADYEEIDLHEEPISEEQRMLALHFGSISQSCQELIKMFYYRNLSIKEIVDMTDYKDENTVKSSKSRCLKRLTTLIKNHNG